MNEFTRHYGFWKGHQSIWDLYRGRVPPKNICVEGTNNIVSPKLSEVKIPVTWFSKFFHYRNLTLWL